MEWDGIFRLIGKRPLNTALSQKTFRSRLILEMTAEGASHVSTATDSVFRAHIRTAATVGAHIRIDLKTAIIIFSNCFHWTFGQTEFTQGALMLIDDIGHFFPLKGLIWVQIQVVIV